MLAWPCYNFAVENVDEYMKLCLISLIQKLIRYYTFQAAAGRRKENMKTELTALAGQRETKCNERKRKHTQTLNFLSVLSCSSNVLVCSLSHHRFASGVGPLFGAHFKIGAVIFVCLYAVLVSVPACLYLVTSTDTITFKPESSPYFHVVAEGGTYLFPLVLHLHRGFVTSVFFSSYF